MIAVLEFLGVLLVFTAGWVMLGTSLFAPIGIGRRSCLPEKYFGWFTWGYWALFWTGAGIHFLVTPSL